MAKEFYQSDDNVMPELPPALTPEEQEDRMISYAMRLAEKQLREGTASSQVITHYLKLGSLREKKELAILDSQKALMDAKKESLQSAKRIEELYERAMKAFGVYSGQDIDEEEDENNVY